MSNFCQADQPSSSSLDLRGWLSLAVSQELGFCGYETQNVASAFAVNETLVRAADLIRGQLFPSNSGHRC